VIKQYATLKWIASVILVIHLTISWVFPEPGILIDLIIFNVVGLLSAVIAFNAPIITDRLAAITIGLACLIWSMGSFISTWNSFFEINIPEIIPDIFYSFFIH